MISIETMKQRTADMVGEEFPLVFWRGKARIVNSSDAYLGLLVRGLRAELTWERVASTWGRLIENRTLTVDELGGGHDAVGLVSLFAHLDKDDLFVNDEDGLLVLKKYQDTPVHQYAEVGTPPTWSPWSRRIHGG